MIRMECRKLDATGTEKIVSVEEPWMAPDEYVNTYFKGDAGSVVFVEVRPVGTEQWTLWRVEWLGPTSYLTDKASYEDARAEIGEHAPS